MTRACFVVSASIGLLAAGATSASEITVIEGARIHTGDGRRIDEGKVLIRGEAIVAVGRDAEVRVPEGARRIDGRGAWVTPGLVDSEAVTGLIEVPLESSTVETHLDERYDAVRAAFSVLDGLNPRSSVIPVTRIEGVTASVLVPHGGLVSGRGAVVQLAGDSVDEMLVRAPAAVWASLAGPGRLASYGARGGAMLRLRELIDDVRQYSRRRQDFERNQMRKVAASRLDLEALLPLVEGKLPLVVHAHRASDIQAALRLAREEKLRLVLAGCEEGWLVAGEIAAAKVPVVINPLANLPRAFEALAARLDNAVLLSRVGVKLALSPGATDDHMSRTLRFHAGNAVASGLPWEDALAAITRNPAEIFGVGERLGTVSPAKSADLVVWSGDPFEPLTRPRHVFIRGREIPLVSRQTKLRDRYRDLRGLRP